MLDTKASVSPMKAAHQPCLNYRHVVLTPENNFKRKRGDNHALKDIWGVAEEQRIWTDYQERENVTDMKKVNILTIQLEKAVLSIMYVFFFEKHIV